MDMSLKTLCCSGCGKRMALTAYKDHKSTCKEWQDDYNAFRIEYGHKPIDFDTKAKKS